MVGKYSGEVVDQSKVSRWFNETEPSLSETRYLAKALEVDPGWLGFGDESSAPVPPDPARATPMPRARR